MGPQRRKLGEVRFYVDPETDDLHIYRHGVSEEEAEEVLHYPVDDFPGRGTSRIALGTTAEGRHLQVVYVPDHDAHGVLVVTAYDLKGKALAAYRRRRRRR